MATLQNCTLTASGKVLIKGTMTATLRNATLSSNEVSIFYANLYINEYLLGKGLTPYSQNNRYYYYHVDINLQLAISEMPDWYRFWFYYPPI